MHVGLDVGYNATKAIAESRKVSFPSVLGSPDRARFGLADDRGAILLMEPQHVLVGTEAVLQSRFQHRREGRNWIESNDWHSLFLAAVTELTSATSVDLDIVTGLPVAFYEDKGKVTDRLMGTHRVQREGRRAQHVRVGNVRVIPQPFGALLAAVLDDRGQIVDMELGRASVGIIDVGGKTCNLLSVQRLSEVSRETASVNVGGWDLVRAVKDWLAANYAGLDDLRDHALAEAIQAREIRYYGELVAAFPSTLDDLAADLAHQVIAEASHLWNGGAVLDAIFITGGGALLLGEYIRGHWKHARLAEDPVHANALGFWKLARRLWGKV